MQLKPRTRNTFDDPDAFLEELARVAKQGYAVDNEEFMDGMIAVAVPVRDKNSRYCASFAFHAPSQRLSLQSALEIQGLVA